MLKVAHIVVAHCHECPFAEKVGRNRLFFCAQQDDKIVRGADIDETCPLDNDSRTIPTARSR